MIPNGKRVLVTGASGFIGCHCVPRLLAQGFEVHAVTSRPLPVGSEADVRWHRIDLLDPASCEALIATVQPTYVLHLAWITTPGVFWSSPDNLNWLASSVTLLRAIGERGGVRVVMTGTCAEYQSNHDRCRETTTPLGPDTVYGRCKMALYQALEAAAESYRFSAAWARLFFPYGPGEPTGRFIPAVIEGLLTRRPVACTDGLQQRDFVYVADVARGLVQLLDSSASGAFNVGSGAAISLREVAAAITDRLGHPELVTFGARPRPPNNPDRVVADIGRMANEVGWRPQVSLDDGLAQTIDDWRRRLSGTAGTNIATNALP